MCELAPDEEDSFHYVTSSLAECDWSEMSARVCTPPVLISAGSGMEFGRGSDRLITSLPDSRGSSCLPDPALTPERSRSYNENFGCGLGLRGSVETRQSSLSDPILNVSRHRGASVSRNLFGSPHPQSAQYARDKVKELRAQDSNRWNFDFVNMRPLPGR